MRRMGFTFDPGALPFATVRRHDWANRLTIGDLIEIHGEHGCRLEPTAARVKDILVGIPAFPPPHLGTIYRGKPLCTVMLEPAPGVWRKVGDSWEQVG
jgi:hypothetical protein